MEFWTSTGTTYKIVNGRLHREASSFGDHRLEITDWPCVRLATGVVVGECVRMFVHGRGWLYTTPVVEIY